MPIVIKSSVKTSSSGAYCGLIYLRTCDYHSISISSVVAVTFTWDSDGNWYLSGGLAPRTPSVSLNFGVIDDLKCAPSVGQKTAEAKGEIKAAVHASVPQTQQG